MPGDNIPEFRSHKYLSPPAAISHYFTGIKSFTEVCQIDQRPMTIYSSIEEFIGNRIYKARRDVWEHRYTWL